MSTKGKTREPKEEIVLGPAVLDGEHVFGVADNFALFNDIVKRPENWALFPNYLERQPSSKYRGVCKCEHEKWDARIMDPIRGVRLWLGTFSSEEEAHKAYQAASLRLEEEKALQCDQSCQKAAGLEDQEMTQKCKFCQEVNQICRYCQNAAAAIIQAKKGKAKELPVSSAAQLLRELELIPDADLGISDSDSMEEVPSRLEEMPLWTENWDSGYF